MRFVILLWLFLLTTETESDLLRDSIHVTSAAARPNNDLWCYNCLAEAPDDKCAVIKDHRNFKNDSMVFKCHNDRRLCMVKRYSYTTSNENTTIPQKMWAIERNCTKHCNPGCIVIGERTKLYACTSCCATDLCNNDSGVDIPGPTNLLTLASLLTVVYFLISSTTL